nr:MAG TPA: hypothetical protein [Caudoviricetes sp.]
MIDNLFIIRLLKVVNRLFNIRLQPAYNHLQPH